MFYNWYSPTTGEKLTTWPDSGDVVYPFLSTVDNGWLAASLRIVREADPALAAQADALYDSMDFASFFDPAGAAGLPAGTNRGGFWDAPPPDCSVEAPMYNGSGATAFYTCHHYDTTVSESRIATYLGIANGQIPADRAVRHAPHDASRMRLGLAGAAAAGRVPHLRRRRGLGGRLLATTGCRSSRAGAAACSSRSCPTCSFPRRSGDRSRGAQPSDHRRRAEAARARRGRIRLLGLLARERPVRRIRGVRRRHRRHAVGRLHLGCREDRRRRRPARVHARARTPHPSSATAS